MMVKTGSTRVIMRLIWVMDNATVLMRGWRGCSANDNAVEEGNRQEYSRVIEKCLVAAEKRVGCGIGIGEGFH